MAKIVWDKETEKFYETGVKHCVLYVWDEDKKDYGEGVAWNGISAINESPSGAESNPIYADDRKWLNLLSTEEFSATIEAYMYPNEFMECDGSACIGTVASGKTTTGVYIQQQSRKKFGLTYVTTIGTDSDPKAAYKIHFIYGCFAAPSEKDNQTISDSPEAATMSWEISTTPVDVTGFDPTATLVIDSRDIDATKLATIEGKIWGTDEVKDGDTVKTAEVKPTLLLPDDVITILNAA